MENYFNYFTEIEEQFLRRRGGGLLLTTLDWALIETWKDAGIPLEAVLRGIDEAFDRYDQRPSKSRKINSLAYCSQAVLGAAEEMKEASVGREGQHSAAGERTSDAGFEPSAIGNFIGRSAEALEKAKFPHSPHISVEATAHEIASTLRKLAEAIADAHAPPKLEDLERRLTALEEKMLAALLAATADEEIVAVRAQADRELAPYRRNMSAAQIDQLQKQYVHKRLFEKYHLPRLSLFYM